MLPAGLLGLGMFTLKESVRWLAVHGRHEEAWESLKWIRADDGETTRLEMEEIRNGVEVEMHAREGFRLIGQSMAKPKFAIMIMSDLLSSEMADKHNWKRTVTAAAVFTAQQATGATA